MLLALGVAVGCASKPVVVATTHPPPAAPSVATAPPAAPPSAPPKPAPPPPPAQPELPQVPHTRLPPVTPPATPTPAVPAPPPPQPPPPPVTSPPRKDPPPVLSPQVTSAEELRLTQEARTRIEGAERLVVQIELRRLAREEQDTVATIKDFLTKSKEAMVTRDVQRAYNLADKAYILAEDLSRATR
jgi:hypothetical protein